MSNAQVRGDSYESGCLGRTGKVLWAPKERSERGEPREESGPPQQALQSLLLFHVYERFARMCVSALCAVPGAQEARRGG